MPKTHLYSRRKVRCKGIKDGRNWYWKFWPLLKEQKEPAPLLNQTEAAAFENEIIHAAEADITALSRKWEETDRKLFPEYCRKLTEKNNLQKKSAQLNKETEDAKNTMLNAKQELDAFDDPTINSLSEKILISLFFIIEIPLNSVIFSIFGSGKTETFIMGTGTALVISVLAYFTGKKLKMHPKTLTDRILLIILPIITIVALTVVSILRATLFGTVQQFSIIKINLDPNTAAIIFVAVNLALFMAAMMTTYAATRPDHRKYAAKRRKFKDAKAAYKKELRDAEGVLEELADAEEALAEAKNKRAKSFAIYCEEAANIANNGEWLIGVYRTANMESRHDSKKPECFKKPPAKITIPDNLVETNISWDCDQLSVKHTEMNLN